MSFSKLWFWGPGPFLLSCWINEHKIVYCFPLFFFLMAEGYIAISPISFLISLMNFFKDKSSQIIVLLKIMKWISITYMIKCQIQALHPGHLPTSPVFLTSLTFHQPPLPFATRYPYGFSCSGPVTHHFLGPPTSTSTFSLRIHLAVASFKKSRGRRSRKGESG